MVRKRLDERVRSLINRGVATGQRSMIVLVGDYGKDQVPNLYQILCKASVRSRPSVLWCYKKELGFSTNRKKRMKRIKRDKARGLLKEGESAADNFELFVSGTDLTWCYYRDTHRVLGTTHGVLVLQDFEALTPNILARTIETVEGGGLVVFLLRTVKSLKQLYTMTMDVHARYRTESGGDLVPRFNERFILSLAKCKNCLVCDDELNILPLSKSALKSLGVADGDNEQTSIQRSDTGEVLVPETPEELELRQLKQSLIDTPHVGSIVELAKTLDQARAILLFLEACSEKTLKSTVALTAARGRGKSAAIGLCLAGAISFGYSTIFVTAPEPENLVAVFDFVLRGLKALKYQEHLDFTVTYNSAKGREATKCVLSVDIHRDHRQTIKYMRPDVPDKFTSAEIVAIDEAAAIPLPTVRALMGDRLTFISSTVNGYEGTGRALSLKLIKELRDAKGTTNSVAAAAAAEIAGPRAKKGEAKVHEKRWAAAAQAAAEVGSGRSPLVEVELSTPIRYASGDAVESWLNRLLCLSCGSELGSKLNGRLPAPSDCELYSVDRDALFSYHKLSESFLQKLMGLYTSAHYKNSPNDLQMLSDAPAHAVFVLLSPSAEADSTTLPDLLAVVQVALEGRISRKAVEAQLARGHRSAGDLIPWTISQQFGDSNFAQLSGARIVRVAVHPSLQGMGYGSRAIELLYRFYNGEIINLSANGHMSDDEEAAESASDTDSEDIDALEVENGIKGETVKPRKKLPPLLLPLTEVKAPPLDWLGTSFGLTNALFKFWKRAGMQLLYLRQTKNELTGEHSAILMKSLPKRTGFDDNWLPAFVADSRRRIITLFGGSFRDMEINLATSLIGDLSEVSRKHGQGTSETPEADKKFDARSGHGPEAISVEELNYLLTPHDLKRLELYGRNLCDHHLVTDLLPHIARLYFTARFGEQFSLSSLQAALLCGIGLQNKTVDSISLELGLPPNQVLAMFNKSVRKISVALHKVVETAEEAKLLGGEARIEAERKADRLKDVTEKTLEEDAKEGAKVAMDIFKKQTQSLPHQIANDYELMEHTIRGTDEQWTRALKNAESEGTKVQIKSTSFEKRKLDAGDAPPKDEQGQRSKGKKSSKKKSRKR